jgi:hypothetical protein
MQFLSDIEQGGRLVARGRPAVRALLAVAVAALAALWLGTLGSPEPNWDEGWTLTAARTWVERGVYAQLSLGVPEGVGLEASFLTVGPVALAFQLLGVGLWQGRFATALLTLASLGALALLARRLYGAAVGLAVVPVLLLTTINAAGNPLYVGRQAMAEPAMLLALALAFLALPPALARPWPWAPLAMLLGGLALVAKAQPTPFWAAGLLAPLPFLLWRRRWAASATLLAILAGTLLARRLIVEAWALAMGERLLPGQSVEGLLQTLALVLTDASRLHALVYTLVIAGPAVLGIGWALWGLLRGLRAEAWADPLQVTRLVLLAFVGSWLAWYLLLSVGWARYLYPVVFLGAVFTAAMLGAWTGGYSPRATWARLREGGAPGRLAFLALLILALGAPLSVWHLAHTYPQGDDRALLEVTAWLNSELPPDAVVETNESELFIYLDRPYHFPPAPVHVVANQRTLLDQQVPYPYDPLAADPDYLVAGSIESLWELYAPAIAAGHFHPVQRIGGYTIYERVRAATP